MDKTDTAILYCLDENAKAPLTVLARKLKISKQKVSYRIKQLEKAKVLLARVAVANVAGFGFKGRKIWLRFQKITSDKEKEIEGYLIRHQNVGWLVRCIGRWDLLMQCWFESDNQFNDFVSLLELKFGTYIGEKSFSIPIMNRYFQRSYLAPEKHRAAPWLLPAESKKGAFDETDIAILDTWGRDISQPIAKVAGKIGLSAAAVAARINKMENTGLILGYKPLLGLEHLDLEYYKATFEVADFSDSVQKEMIKFFSTEPEVIYITISLGKENLEIEVEASGLRKIYGIIKKFRYRFGVQIKNFEMTLIDVELKHGHLPPMNPPPNHHAHERRFVHGGH